MYVVLYMLVHVFGHALCICVCLCMYVFMHGCTMFVYMSMYLYVYVYMYMCVCVLHKVGEAHPSGLQSNESEDRPVWGFGWADVLFPFPFLRELRFAVESEYK